jgi:hypothetical protein
VGHQILEADAMSGAGKAEHTSGREFEGLVNTAVEHIVNENPIFAGTYHIEIVLLIVVQDQVFAGNERRVVNVEIDLAFAGISSDLDYVASDQEDVVFGDQAADVGSVSASGQQTQATNIFFGGFLLDIGLLGHC